jgi:two-component system, chemotaxis family, sensor kinase Cph1
MGGRVMSPSEIPLPPGELQRLAECVLEPIRFPGAIQPHGALFAAEPTTLLIRHVSDNSARIVGADPLALLGRSLSELLGDDAVAAIRDILDPDTVVANPARISVAGEFFDAIANEFSGLVLVELEPTVADEDGQVAAIRAAFRRLSKARTVQELWAETAIELRRITGFDRVMVYHFYPDDHGEVVAEAVAEDMEPYLGLHYPASDIPAQARQLYLTKLSRQIASSGGESAALLSDANVDHPDAVDLSYAELRAVSPHHLEFMRNMGQASTFSLSLIRNGELVGMITCAHRTDRRISYGVRDGLELLANQVSLQLGAMTEIERLDRRNQMREVRGALVLQADRSEDLLTALLHQTPTILDLIPADGASIRLGGRVESIGMVPAPDQISSLPEKLAEIGAALSFASSSIPQDFPDLAASLRPVAGLLVRPLGGDGDFIAWYRGEVTQTVDWLGDMSPANRLTPLSPRNSFSSWTQEVTGTSAAWDGLEREAAALCRDLDSVLLHRAESRLAELALRDALTGLPNRRLLMDRLEHSLAHQVRGEEVAVLFVDLDRFKAINDTYGHAAGDAALVHVARSLESAARSQDTVARIGGDEFVVVCERTSRRQAERVAARLLAALAALPETDVPSTVSASVGIAMADGELTASQLLSAADAAMYHAKTRAREAPAAP